MPDEVAVFIDFETFGTVSSIIMALDLGYL
jgi:hypothetical protein